MKKGSGVFANWILNMPVLHILKIQRYKGFCFILCYNSSPMARIALWPVVEEMPHYTQVREIRSGLAIIK